MQESSTTVATILQFRQELERQLRDQIRQAVEVILDEEPGGGTEDAALTLLFGLVAFGQIQLRRIDGYQQLPSFLAAKWQNVA